MQTGSTTVSPYHMLRKIKTPFVFGEHLDGLMRARAGQLTGIGQWS